MYQNINLKYIYRLDLSQYAQKGMAHGQMGQPSNVGRGGHKLVPKLYKVWPQKSNREHV